jgi:hypothetical protein
MIAKLRSALTWGMAVWGPVAPAQAPRPPAIASISVCSPTGTGGPGSCPNSTFDTHQIVLGPGGVSVNMSPLSVVPVPDEHSTVFAPGTLGTNQDYLFLLASQRTRTRRGRGGGAFRRLRTGLERPMDPGFSENRWLRFLTKRFRAGVQPLDSPLRGTNRPQSDARQTDPRALSSWTKTTTFRK